MYWQARFGIFEPMSEYEASHRENLQHTEGLPAASGEGEVLDAILVVDRRRRRRRRLPILLFLATCFTTYAAGCYRWNIWETPILGSPMITEVEKGETYTDAEGKTKVSRSRQTVLVSWRDGLKKNWRTGLMYMGGVMLILLFHEMGHFIMTLRYKVPASFPFFIPVPMMLMGTLGAVIGMDPRSANRKQVFDIGLAGPLAGLVLTIPLLVYGLSVAEPVPQIPEARGYGDPLLVKMLIPVLHDLEEVKTEYAKKHNDPSLLEREFTFMVNPIYMAAWVGMLVTGLNMLPISQLDGGHVAYALFGRYTIWLAGAFLLVAIVFIVWTDSYNWMLMLILVLFIGIEHPPTADDTVKLGPWRYALGLASLAIPVFCFTPFILIMGG